MRFIADFHIHSRFSRATSKDMTPEGLARWAQIKGVSVMGTGDFTHPVWLKELKEKLEPASEGLFRLKAKYAPADVPDSCKADVFFMPTAEISCIYSKNGRVRKVHLIVLLPGFKETEGLNKKLSKIGNLSADGRPILGLDAKKLLQLALDTSPDMMLIPAHAWTPHFSVFGAFSGFDSLDECFDELTPHVHAIETGLSSDPPMNRRLPGLDKITLVSFSDAHSPRKIAREATVFDTELSYPAMVEAIRTKKGFGGTVEFFPEEGKYHWDGHRACGVSMPPEETVKHNYKCPVCGKRLTIGVLHRVEKLRAPAILGLRAPAVARPLRKGPGHPFYSLIPLEEILSEVLGRGVNTKTVQKEYFRLIEALGNELKVLMDTPVEEIAALSEKVAEAITRVRKGDVEITPGFDGEYGKIKISGRPKRPKDGIAGARGASSAGARGANIAGTRGASSAGTRGTNIAGARGAQRMLF